jgi:Secretion system C-terminal sorting domain/CARDB
MVRLTKLIFILVLLQFPTILNIYSQTIVFQDNMNGDNSISGLESRGWTVTNGDGAGLHPAWFQGNLYNDEFNAYEGDVNAYVASDWEGTNSNDIVDHWLISPELSVSAGDTLSFWIRSGSASFLDTLYIYISEDGTIGSLNLEYFYPVPKTEWVRSTWVFNNAGTILFAFRYYVFDSSTNGWYIGIDDVKITSPSVSSGADLIAQSLAVSDFNWQVGSNITSELKIENVELVSAASHRSQLYLSTDQTINTQDVPLGSALSYNSIAGGGSQTVSETFTVPSISDGIYFMGILVDIDNDVSEINENNSYYWDFKIVVGYPESITLGHNVSFGNSSDSSSYRMIGIPGNVNIPISQSLSGSHEEDWVAFHDNGNSAEYIISYDGSNTFNFKPGNGFWILANSNFSISQSVNSVELQNVQMNTLTNEIVFPISIHDGWNIISNPFETNVNWDDVKLFNTVNEDIHSFSGSFSTTSSFQPYNGYYFYNVNNISQLYIPYSSSGNNPNTIPKINERIDELTVFLHSNGFAKSTINIGFRDDAKISYDHYDRFTPPGDFEEHRISIFNEILETDYKYLLTDYRGNMLNQIYSLVIKNPIGDSFNLSFDGIDKIDGMKIYLVDQNANFHNVKMKNNISLNSTSATNNMQLLIGDESFIEAQKTALLPKQFSLNQNYPNPFNPSTKISYAIPEQSDVTLEVFDMLGRKVRTLVKKEQSQGNYLIEFTVNSLTSGIYFYKFQAGDFEATNKMILLK